MSRASYAVFFSIAFIVFFSAYGWVGWRLLGPFGTTATRVGWLLLFGHLACVFLSFSLLRSVGVDGWVRIIHWVAFLGMGLFGLLFVGLVFREVVWALLWVIDRLGDVAGMGTLLPHDPERRAFLSGITNGGILTLSGVIGVWGVRSALGRPRLVQVDVPIEGLPAELTGYRIAQITDLHVGPTIARSFVDVVTAAVNELAPDLIAVTGDLVDGSPEQLLPQMAALGDLKATDGVFFVTGNHEYYSGAVQWCKTVTGFGWTVLNNAHRIVRRGDARLLVAGVTDHRAHTVVSAHKSDAKKAVAGAESCDVRLLLAHQPKSCLQAVEVGFDLQLSGHTHGGQMWPWNFLVPLSQPFTKGLNRMEKMWVYVSQGTGYWGPPMRVGIPSEITLIRLVAAD